MWLDKVKKSIEIVTNFRIKKDWSTIQKGDKLYLLVPFYNDGMVKYNYQESSVINVHYYDNHINIRFKYSDINGKRHRIGLSVNKTKFDQKCVTTDKRTGWATIYKPIYGDLFVTYIDKEELNNVYLEAIKKEIDKYDKIISDAQNMVGYLRNIQYDKIV